MYNCKIIADSINTFGNRITTFKLTYPRIVHAELMTHRLFSRNAASSRAIPVRKMIESVRNNMFTPLAIQKAHKGMQGTDYFEGVELEQAKQLWVESAELAIQQAEKMERFGISKQLVNRVVEPYQYYQVLVTATEWENFFSLRCPKYYYDLEDKYFRSKKDWLEYYKKTCIGDVNSDFTLKEEDWFDINKSQAEIHIQKIAEMMLDAYNESTPKQLQEGEWHIPFGDRINLISWLDIVNDDDHLDGDLDEQDRLFIIDKLKISTARCARLSYTTLGDNPKIDYEADIKLHDKLLKSKHFSCFEHCARAMSEEEYESFYKGERANKEDLELGENKGWCNNYRGFVQYRYLVENSL